MPQRRIKLRRRNPEQSLGKCGDKGRPGSSPSDEGLREECKEVGLGFGKEIMMAFRGWDRVRRNNWKNFTPRE